MAALQTNPSSSSDSRTVSNPASHNSKQEDRATDPPKGFSIPTAAGSRYCFSQFLQRSSRYN
jgi:hypothetical protein